MRKTNVKKIADIILLLFVLAKGSILVDAVRIKLRFGWLDTAIR